MNSNYKFSRRLETSVFGRKSIRDRIVEDFRPEKKSIVEEDLGTVDTGTNVVFTTYSGTEMYRITHTKKDLRKLKPATFEGILKGIKRKHDAILRAEVKEFKKWQKEQEKAKKAEKPSND